MLKKLIILLGLFAIENSIHCAEAQNAIDINYITKVSDEDLGQIQPGDTCAICLENLSSYTSDLYKSNCRQMLTMRPHIFHRDCILGSIRSGHAAARNCPVCRGEMIDLNAALIQASTDGHLERVRLLINRGANVNARNNDYYEDTPLMIASIYGDLEAARLLIDRGANINAGNNDGHTALMLASHNRHLETIRLLIGRGADVNARNNNGDTPLMVASSRGHLEAVRLLIDRGADINARNNDGNTPLIFASYNGDLETARLLLNSDADINARNNDGETALTIASRLGHLRIEYLLIEYLLRSAWHRMARCTIS